MGVISKERQEEKTSFPVVELPEGTVDISALICDLNLRAEEKSTYHHLYAGLQDIENQKPLLLYGGSNDYERLLTSDGAISLDGAIMRWILRGKPVALATLWERYPKFRQYLWSRTRRFIAVKQDELNLLDIEDSFAGQGLVFLALELEALEYEE